MRKILIEVVCGSITHIITDSDTQIILVDWDNDEEDRVREVAPDQVMPDGNFHQSRIFSDDIAGYPVVRRDIENILY